MIKKIIGIDETNNGFSLKSFNHNHKPHLIVTAYLSDKKGMKEYRRAHYEKKGKIFNGKKNIEFALKNGKHYLSEHPDFLYTAVPQEYQKTKPSVILKAEACTLLILNFFLRYDLNPNETEVVMDEMDGEIPSKQINQMMELWLKQSGLILKHRSMRSAASNVYAVRKADMVSYYLTAIHLLGENPQWPYHRKKVQFSDLEKSVDEFIERNKNYSIKNLK